MARYNESYLYFKIAKIILCLDLSDPIVEGVVEDSEVLFKEISLFIEVCGVEEEAEAVLLLGGAVN